VCINFIQCLLYKVIANEVTVYYLILILCYLLYIFRLT